MFTALTRASAMLSARSTSLLGWLLFAMSEFRGMVLGGKGMRTAVFSPVADAASQLPLRQCGWRPRDFFAVVLHQRPHHGNRDILWACPLVRPARLKAGLYRKVVCGDDATLPPHTPSPLNPQMLIKDHNYGLPIVKVVEHAVSTVGLASTL